MACESGVLDTQGGQLLTNQQCDVLNCYVSYFMFALSNLLGAVLSGKVVEDGGRIPVGDE